MKKSFSQNSNIRIRKIISFILLFIVCTIVLVPLLWAFGTAFKLDVLTDPLSFIPKEFTLNNFNKLFSKADLPIFTWFYNSLKVAIIHTILYLIIASLAAYAFGVLQWKGRNVFFWILLSTAMIPSIINLVPLYQMFRDFGLNQTHLALILPGLGGVFSMFLMRQFFMNIPKEMCESAILDGLSMPGVYLKIIIPLSKSAFMVVAILTFIGSWNDYLWPSIVMAGADPSMLTLPLGMAKMLGDNNMDYGLTMAGAIMSTLPTFIVYLFLQNKIVDSVAYTGSKS